MQTNNNAVTVTAVTVTAANAVNKQARDVIAIVCTQTKQCFLTARFNYSNKTAQQILQRAVKKELNANVQALLASNTVQVLHLCKQVDEQVAQVYKTVAFNAFAAQNYTMHCTVLKSLQTTQQVVDDAVTAINNALTTANVVTAA